jgi:hypothetical protein
MIVCTIVIGGQLDYLQNKDLGYQKSRWFIIPTNKPRLKGMELAELYRNELLNTTGSRRIGIAYEFFRNHGLVLVTVTIKMFTAVFKPIQ